ncbi:MAG: fibronectin type III domain-containing protein [Acidimicrobiia bacterium]|nr:fibronectin type III domain-containing protein [Acidimicrobiia bacterium]
MTDAPPTAGTFAYRVLAAPDLVAVKDVQVAVGTPQVVPPALPPLGDRTVPLPGYADTALDDVHHRIFVSTGSNNSVLALDADGDTIGEVTGLSGASALAMDPAGTTLYAALDGATIFAVIDTKTLSVIGRFQVPAAAHPIERFWQAGVTGGKVAYTWVYNDPNAGQQNGWGLIPTADPGAALNGPNGWGGEIWLAANPARPEVALVGEYSAASADVFDVSGDHPLGLANAIQFPVDDNAFSVDDVRYSPDGRWLYVAPGSPDHEMRVDPRTLKTTAEYTTDPYPIGGATTRDGRFLATLSSGYGDPIIIWDAGRATEVRRYAARPFFFYEFGAGSNDFSDDATRLYDVAQSGPSYAPGASSLEIHANPLAPCSISLSLGLADSGAYLRVTGQLTDNDGHAVAGAGVTLDANGVALPAATTRSDGSFAIPSQAVASSSVTVTARSQPVAGRVACVLRALAGSAGPLPLVPPAAPVGVTATAGNAFLSTDWQPPADDGGLPVLSYSVAAVRQDGAIAAWQNVAADVRELSLPRLVNGTPYDVYVFAWNRLGGGSAAHLSGATPSASGPSGQRASAPTGVSVQAGNGHVTASWQPSVDDGGAPVTAYSVVAVDQQSGAAYWSHVAPDVRSASVAGLSNGRTYNVAVVAWTARGIGFVPPWVTAAPSEVGTGVQQPSAPADLYVNPGVGSLFVQWLPALADGGSPITAYSAAAVDSNNHVLGWVNTGPDGRAANIAGIPSGTVCDVVVFAWSGAGGGQAVRVSAVRVG